MLPYKECNLCHKVQNERNSLTSHNGGYYYPYCRDCTRDRHLAHKFGVPIEEIRKLRAEQDECYLCFREPKMLDHCHETGRIRKFLCSRCNQIVGAIERGVARRQYPPRYYNYITEK